MGALGSWCKQQALDAWGSLRSPGPYFRLGLIIAIVIAVADRLSKWWVLYGVGLTEGDRIPVTSFFSIHMVWNPGISYGLLPAQSAWAVAVLLIFAVVVVSALLVWMARVENRLLAIAVANVIGGAVGNAYDRAVYGAVADFFSFILFGFPWYVFNVADVAIVVGVALMIYDSLFGQTAREGRDGEEA